MTEHKRSKEDRRYRSGTRSDVSRRESPSDNWKFIEKRHQEDRRSSQRRKLSDRRIEPASP